MRTKLKKIVFVIVLILCLAPVMYADWVPSDGHKMHFPQFPDPCGWDIDLRNYWLADDWQCSQSGPVSDIHFWISWAQDYVGTIPQFTVQIYRNDANLPSKPLGTSVWTRTFLPGQFVIRPDPNYGNQGYWIPNPTDPSIHRPDHTMYFQVNMKNITDPFVQEEGKIYWLAIKVPPDMYYYPGWKTSLNHFMDNAVVKYPAGWTPLWDPYETVPIDFAFVITGGLPPSNIDFGDAPDSALVPGYPTLLANNGARHTIDGVTFMGALVDAEGNGQPTANADGDDTNPLAGPDDEDGVVFPVPLIAGQPASVTVTASVPGMLDAWIDFNADGSWAQVGDQIAASLPLAAGANVIGFVVPATATPGQTYARFRFSTAGGLLPTGLAPNGEVEDYMITIDPNVKWLQRPDLSTNGLDVMASDPLILADDFECNKTTLITDITIWGSWKDDMPPEGRPNDVRFTLSIHSDIPSPDPCDPAAYSMPGNVLWLMNMRPSEGSIEKAEIDEGWYDPYYSEYYFPGDHVCRKYVFHIPEANAFCQKGTTTNPITYWLDVQAHPNDVTGNAKFGWKSSINHWNDDAVWVNGVEPYVGSWNELRYPYEHPLEGNSIDLAFAIDGNKPCAQAEDFGDAPDGAAAPGYPTLLINNGARHIIDGVTFMGALVDAEGDGQPTANADGDDLNPPLGPDDEDGVAFPVPLVPGQPASVTVTASVAGALDAWVDFDADGSWAQAGDQIAAALPLGAGANMVGFVVPATATIGQTYARFRFSTAGGLQPFGPASNGEVEDYAVFIEELQPQPENELGDAPDSTNNSGLAMTAYPLTAVVANYPTVYLTGSPPFGPIHLQPQAVAYLGQNVTLENEADIGPDQDPTNNIIPPIDTPDQDLADDGVLNMPISLPKCYSQTIFNYQINVVNPGIDLYVNVWFDWNRDGDWDDTLSCGGGMNAPEWAVQNQLFPAGLPIGLNTVTTPQFVPWHSTLTKEKIWMRITLSEQPWVSGGIMVGDGGSGPAAGYYFGETEDYFFEPDPNCLYVGRVFDKSICNPPLLANITVTQAMVNMWNAVGKPQCWCCDAHKCGNGIYVPAASLNKVDAADLAQVKKSFNKTYLQVGYVACVDFNLSGKVDASDLAVLKKHFNKIVGSAGCQ